MCMYKLLIIDDDMEDIRQLNERLDDVYSLEFTDNINEGIRLISENSFSGIIISFMMEGKDCFTVLDYLKDTRLIETIPVIVIVSEKENDIINGVYNYDICDAIHKPFGNNTLKNRIRNVVNLYEQKKDLIVSNSELERAIIKANEAVDNKTRFLFNMSHDIRTPMNAIIGLAEMTKKYMNDNAKAVDCLTKLMSASNHLLGIIDDLLDISYMEQGKMLLAYERCNLADIVRDISNIIIQQCKDKNIKFDLTVNNLSNEAVIADPKRLRQAFINILCNSVKFTENQGVVGFDITEIKSDKADKSKYIFRLSDNGIGMSESFVKKMFVPFEREEDQSRPYIEGTGLGLAITKNIIDCMGGKIDVVSKLNVGTQISIELEFDKDCYAKSAYTDVYKKYKAAVVDYDRAAGLDVVSEFEVFGIETVYYRGLDGILASDDLPDIVAVRLVEGDKGSLEMTCEIKEMYPDIKFIKILDRTSEYIVEENDTIFESYVQRPIFPSDLKKSLDDVLGLSEKKIQGIAHDEFLKGKRALVVDDNEINRMIVVEFLSYAGIKADNCESGIEALNILNNAREGYYDIILMDLLMPGMDGYETASRIRDMPEGCYKDIPIVILSADAFAREKVLDKRNHMNGFLCKPFTREALYETIYHSMA